MKLKNWNCDETKKNQLVTKFKNFNCDETQKLKWWQNSKNLIVTKLKNSNWDKTQNIKLWPKINSNWDETQVVTQLKLWQNSICEEKSSCEKTLVTKLKLWEEKNSKTQNMTQLKFLQIWKTQIMTKLNTSHCDKTQKLKLWQNLNYDNSRFMKNKNLKGSFRQNILTPWQPMRCSLGSVLRFLRCFMFRWLGWTDNAVCQVLRNWQLSLDFVT